VRCDDGLPVHPPSGRAGRDRLRPGPDRGAARDLAAPRRRPAPERPGRQRDGGDAEHASGGAQRDPGRARPRPTVGADREL